MARTFDVCVRGAGIVGRTLALHLASKRLRVALVSTPLAANPGGDTAPACDVRAYALNQRSRELLEAVRCWPPEEFATPVTRMEVDGDEGGHVSFSATQQGVSALNWIVDVPELENLLANALRFQPLIEVFDTPQAAALTVVCEGRTSSTRAEFGAEFEVTPYGQWALAARVQCALPHGQIARQWFSRGEILAFLPLGGAQGNACAVVWSVSPERAQELETMAPEAFGEALQTASNSSLGAVALASVRAAWPLQQAQALRWSGTGPQGCWVLAGDAAHNVHPLAGQGLNLGLGDVDELVHILDGRPYWRSVGDPKLLRQYERARKADLAMVGQAGDALQRLFNHTDPAVRTLRNWGMNGFERSGAIKEWVARRAMGAAPQSDRHVNQPAKHTT